MLIPMAVVMLACLPWTGPVWGVDFLRPTPNFYSTAEPIRNVAVADLDEDGIVEVITLQTPRIVIWQVMPGGILRESNSVASGVSGPGMLFTDIDDDDHRDLVLGRPQAQVEIRLGTGSATFGTTWLIPVTRVPSTLQSGDFDGDGRQDVLVGYGGGTAGPTFSVLYGVADAIPERVDFNTAGRAGGFVNVGDFDGDGRLDVAGASNAGLDFFYGEGGRSFTYGGRVTIPSPAGAAAGDFDEDGVDDIGFSSGGDFQSGNGFVVSGRHDRQPGPPVLHVPDIGSSPHSCYNADIDADGHQDLVFGGYTLLTGWGDGTGDFPSRSSAGYDWNWGRLAFADLNWDGYLDVVGCRPEADFYSGRLGVVLSSEPRCAPFESFWRVPDGAVDVVPLAADGARSRLAIPRASGLVDILESERWGHFEVVGSVLIGGSPGVGRAVDFDEDGTDEFVLVDQANRQLRTMGRSAGQWGVIGSWNTDGYPLTLEVQDLDEDGRPEIIVVDATESALRVWTSDATGHLTPVGSTALVMSPDGLALADLDADGRTEAVVHQSISGRLLLLGGLTAGEWVESREFLLEAGLRQPTFANLDGIGAPELLLLAPTQSSVRILRLPLGDGEIESYDMPLEHVPDSFVATDINRDGLMDIVVASLGDLMISSYRGDGHGALQLDESYRTLAPPTLLRLIDADRDNWSDISWVDPTGPWGRSFWNVYQYVPVSRLQIKAVRESDGILIEWQAGDASAGSTFGLWQETAGGERVVVNDRVPGGPDRWPSQPRLGFTRLLAQRVHPGR
ncbi:MAG: VCBS repeat-containing protein [Candidatus Eisenbacteria bacterium]|nr:VCBS repeat-containing protein [Candidatus Eisenbacteria bacterium]